MTDDSLESEWADQLRFAATPGGWLESGHIFALANALRRPILVHGSFAIDEAANVTGVNFMRGIYLPLLHAPAECCRDPLAIWCVSLVRVRARECCHSLCCGWQWRCMRSRWNQNCLKLLLDVLYVF